MISPLDNYLLRAYLDGEMDASTTQAFEIRLIEQPELAEFVDADSALGIGLRAADASVAQAAPAAPVVALPSAPPAAPSRRVARVVPYLAAAAILVAVGVGVGRLQQRGAAALVPATTLQIETMRSAVVPETKRYSVPASGSVVLAVPVVTVDGCPAHVKISQGNVVLATDVTVDGSRFANLVADASRLPSGAALIESACIGDKPAKYTVEFVR